MAFDPIEIQFIKEELDKHAELLSELFTDAIKYRDLKDTGDLLSIFASENPFRITEQGGQVVLSAKFPYYGRFIEIQQQSAKKRIRTERPDTNALIWGISDQKRKRKKSKNAQWYTRNVFGAQNRLIGRLMYGLGEAERERIKGWLMKGEKK